MAFGADGHGICHAAADGGGAAACADGVVAGLLLFKLPKLDRVVLDDDGALVAAQLDALVPAGVGARRTLDDAECAVCEAQRGDRGVLDADAFVRERGDVRLHLDGHADEPREQINRVDALIHERTAAVHLPSAAPACAVVIGLRAPPLHVGAGDGETAEAACVHGALHGARAFAEAALENCGEDRAACLRCSDDGVNFLHIDLHRLLAEHVLAGLQRGDGGLAVRTARRGDAHGVHVLARDEFVNRSSRGAVPFFAKWLQACDRIRGGELRTGDFADGLCVNAGDVAGADECEADGCGHGVRVKVVKFVCSAGVTGD